jgi:hypothetical protein
MTRIIKSYVVALLSLVILVMMSTGVNAAPNIDKERLEKSILEYTKKIYNSMLADSDTCFTKNDYPTIDSYLVAKTIEAFRDYYLIDYPEGITNIVIDGVRLEEDTITFEGADLNVNVLVDSTYCYNNHSTKWGNRYRFTVDVSQEQYVVKDIIALEGDHFLNNKEAIPNWRGQCKIEDGWEYEAIDYIVDSKKVDLDELVDIQEIEKEPIPSGKEEKGAKSVTVSYNKTAAAQYAYTTAPSSYDPNYIFCSVPGADCTNFVSQCVWAGYGGTSGYILPVTPSNTDAVITALRNRVQNDYRMVTGSWYGRYWRNPQVTPPANWCGVVDFWDYAVGNTGSGPVATGFNNNKKWNQYSGTIQRGDVLQFKTSSGSSY